MEDAQAVTISPLRKPARKSSYSSALANHRHDQLSGGKDRMALLLKAASVTTNAGNTRKARMASTMSAPMRRKSLCDGNRGMSMRPDAFERARGGPHQGEHRERENESGDRQARGERKVEAGESKLIDEVRDHVDAAAADQLRGCESAEGPGERSRDAGDDPGRREWKRHREKGADWAGAEACRRSLVIAIDMRERGCKHDHHYRQGDVDERGNDAEPGEHELQGLFDQPGLEQHRVHEAAVAEHDDPGIGAHHLAEEQRGDRDHQDGGLERNAPRMHQRVGERISDDEREERREEADPDRIEEYPRIERLHEC